MSRSGEKVALVTCGSCGIGAAVAKRLATEADAADVAAVKDAIEKSVAVFGRLDVLER